MDDIESMYEVADYGLGNAQYFPGHGVAFTDYDQCALGCGDTYNEALADALECASDGLPADLADYIEKHEMVSEGRNATISASAEVESQLDSEFPIKYRVAHVGYCGMTTHDETFDELSDAIQNAKDIITIYVASLNIPTDQVKDILADLLAQCDNAADDGSDVGATIEIREPEGCAMVPDECGVLTITSNAADVLEKRECAQEDSELYYYVGLRWKSIESK